MPQATDELREKMNTRFGSPIDDSGPYDFLISKGWKCHRGMLSKDTAQLCTEEEYDCVDFLIQEWDYGVSA